MRGGIWADGRRHFLSLLWTQADCHYIKLVSLVELWADVNKYVFIILCRENSVTHQVILKSQCLSCSHSTLGPQRVCWGRGYRRWRGDMHPYNLRGGFPWGTEGKGGGKGIRSGWVPIVTRGLEPLAGWLRGLLSSTPCHTA